MKKLILPLLLVSVLLAGCGSNQATFEQKQECANYKNEIEQEIKSNTNNTSKLDEIFYSKKYNSCIYTINGLYIGAYDYLKKKEVITPTRDITACYEAKKNEEKYNEEEANKSLNACIKDYNYTKDQLKELKGE